MGEEDPLDRGNWTGRLDFILSCIGYAVGLGNIWRFPYLCYRNGGGAFLIPYVIMLVLAGLPLFLFELCLGQFSSEGPITVWKVVPLATGIGWAMVTISAMICVYYNVIIMYSIFYMFVSLVYMDDEVPWANCENEWNTGQCRSEPYPRLANMNETNKINASLSTKHMDCVEDFLPNMTSYLKTSMNSVWDLNSTMLADNFTHCEKNYRTPSEEYWTNHVLRLHESDGIGSLGGISVKNLLCLIIAWVIIFFCLMKGIKSSGKVVYFTATFPYVILIVLFIRGITLPGFEKGIEFYIIPKWEQLKTPKVWGDAATQIFYSLGPAFGSLITMSSYNRFKNNCFRDALIVAVVNCATSVFGGFVIFSLLGYMSHKLNVPVEEVAADGPGLAFVAYPEGIAQLPYSPIWAFLFFFMIFTLGLDSQFAMMETVISGLSDKFPKLLRPRKALFTFICCVIGLCLGIPQVTKGGIYVLTLMDWYSASYNLMIVSLCELIAINWLYGFPKFRQDVEMMLGRRGWNFWWYWAGTWTVVTPLVIVFILIMSAVFYTPAGYNGVPFPDWAEGIGWLMVTVPLAFILIGGIYAVIVKGGIRQAIQPDPTWGPALDENRRGKYGDINLGFVGDNGKQPTNEKMDLSEHL